jgi:hypothetical protein
VAVDGISAGRRSREGARTRRAVARLVLILLTVLVAGCLTAGAASAASPYPASGILGGISWDLSSKQRYASTATTPAGSDIWDSMWASDGNVYGAWGDGAGFACTSKHQIGVTKLVGSPPSTLTGTDFCGGSPPAGSCLTLSTIGGKPRGVVALPTSTMYMFHLIQDKCTAEVLAKSTNNGTSWADVNPTTLTWPDANGFSPGSILQYGQAQAGSLAPESAPTRYIYIYGHKGTDLTHQYLARVDMTGGAIESTTNWSYFSGTAMSPAWSSSSASATVVFTDPDHSQTIQVTFDKSIGRYIAYNDHGSTCGGPCERQVGLFDAPSPWGPWTTFDYEENFDNTGCGSNCLGNGEAVGWSMMQKWFSSDGLTIWPEYNSTDLSATALYDSLNLIKGTISLASGATIKNLNTSTGTPAVVAKLSQVATDQGSLEYIDRTYQLTSVPAAYQGKEAIHLANNDKAVTASNYLTFTVTPGQAICVAWDQANPAPTWLTTSPWVKTTNNLVGNATFNVYRNATTFASGSVTLPGPNSHDVYIPFVGC